MIFRDRCDGRRVRDLNPFQKVLPYIMRTRNESLVYFAEDIDVENALSLVKRLNGEAGSRDYGLFQLILAALVQVLVKKPKLNRFVSGRGIYDRKDISMSFIVKKKLTEEARETDAKVIFERDSTLIDVTRKVNESIENARSEVLSPDEKEMYLAAKIPGAYRLVTAAFRLLNGLNLAPASMIKADPLFTSIYVANLASIGLLPPFHHLYEWGTASVFVVLGKMERRMVEKDDGTTEERHFMRMKVTLDERIAEGIYFSHALDLFRRLLKNPEVLLGPAASWSLTNGKPETDEAWRQGQYEGEALSEPSAGVVV